MEIFVLIFTEHFLVDEVVLLFSIRNFPEKAVR